MNLTLLIKWREMYIMELGCSSLCTTCNKAFLVQTCQRNSWNLTPPKYTPDMRTAPLIRQDSRHGPSDAGKRIKQPLR